MSAEDEIADSVFVQSYIPKTLNHVKNVEKDVIRITSGKDTGDLYYKTITGLKEALPKVQSSTAKQEQEDAKTTPVKGSSLDPAEENESEAESTSGSETDEDEENWSSSDEKGPSSNNVAAVDKKAARKENKKKVKEEKMEAPKTKAPKAVKKRKKKLAKAHKTR